MDSIHKAITEQVDSRNRNGIRRWMDASLKRLKHSYSKVLNDESVVKRVSAIEEISGLLTGYKIV